MHEWILILIETEVDSVKPSAMKLKSQSINLQLINDLILQQCPLSMDTHLWYSLFFQSHQ